MSSAAMDRYNGPPTLTGQLQLAEELAKSNLLPDSFRRQPANVLWSIEYAKTLNISVLAAVTGVHVMDGKPTASAGLMTALVRRAGHKVRTRTQGTVAGGDFSATCTIIRSDDPDNPFSVTWDLDRAVRAELIDQLDCDEQGRTIVVARTQKGHASNWQKYTETMCKHRATSECARDAAEDALFGLHYTPEELGAEVDFTADGHTIVTGQVLAQGDEVGDDPRAWRAAMDMAQRALNERDPQRLLNGYALAESEGLLDWDITTVLTDEDEVRADLAGNCTLGALIRTMQLRRKAERDARSDAVAAVPKQRTPEPEQPVQPTPVSPQPQADQAEPTPGAVEAAKKLVLTAAAESSHPRLQELYRSAGSVLLRIDITSALTPQQRAYVKDTVPVKLGTWLVVCGSHAQATGDSIDTSINLDPANQETHAP